jgi:hypothetical protein
MRRTAPTVLAESDESRQGPRPATVQRAWSPLRGAQAPQLAFAGALRDIHRTWQCRPQSDALKTKLLLVIVMSGLALVSVAFAVPGQTRNPPKLREGCSDNSPCQYSAGAYQLSSTAVVPGLRLTLPPGWSSTENNRGELSLTFPGHPNDRLLVWIDMVAVKSTGPGHGRPLPNVGRTPQGLINWLLANRALSIVSRPARISVAHGIKMTTLALTVSKAANYGDSGCPANPRCADLFTRPGLWGNLFYGIGGPEEVRLYVGRITSGNRSHVFIVALDAENHSRLLHLRMAAQPILASMRAP